MRAADTILFWGHVAFIFLAIATGIFLPLKIVVLLVILHRLHVHFFDGCLLSKLQQRIGALAHEHNFLQEAARRLFRKEITLRQSKILDYSLAMSPVLLAALI